MNPASLAFSGTIPENYDRYLGPLLFEPYALDLVARLPEGVTDALETACGTGRVTRHLREALPGSTRLVATDLNPDMVVRARIALPDVAVEWQTADAQQLPFPDASFDLVVCQFGIMFVPDKALAYREAWRVLRPGGTFLFNTWDSHAANPLTATAQEVVMRFFTENPPRFLQIPYSYSDESTIRTHLSEAGFEQISLESVVKEGQSLAAGDVARGFVEGTPVSLAIKDRDPALLDIIREAATQALAERFGAGPTKGQLRAWVAEARKPR